MYKEKMTPRQALSTAIFLAEEAADTDVKAWKTDMLQTIATLKNLKQQFEESEERMLFTNKAGSEVPHGQKSLEQILAELRTKYPLSAEAKKHIAEGAGFKFLRSGDSWKVSFVPKPAAKDFYPAPPQFSFEDALFHRPVSMNGGIKK